MSTNSSRKYNLVAITSTNITQLLYIIMKISEIHTAHQFDAIKILHPENGKFSIECNKSAFSFSLTSLLLWSYSNLGWCIKVSFWDCWSMTSNRLHALPVGQPSLSKQTDISISKYRTKVSVQVSIHRLLIFLRLQAILVFLLPGIFLLGLYPICFWEIRLEPDFAGFVKKRPEPVPEPDFSI